MPSGPDHAIEFFSNQLAGERWPGSHQWNWIDERTSAVIACCVVGVKRIADISGLLLRDDSWVSPIEEHIQGVQLRLRFGPVPQFGVVQGSGRGGQEPFELSQEIEHDGVGLCFQWVG